MAPCGKITYEIPIHIWLIYMLQGANLETQIDIFKKPKINEGKFPTEAANANNTNKKT
jgi:hypothetical protein